VACTTQGGAALKRGNYVKFTDEWSTLSANATSKISTTLFLQWHPETPEFQRQTRDFAAALMAAGKPVQLIVGCYNHYEMGETLGNPYAIMTGRAQASEADDRVTDTQTAQCWR
jgi:arylformamidase